jgi:hypothetical protein
MSPARIDEGRLVELLRLACRRGGGVRQWASNHHMKSNLIYDILRYRRRITPNVYLALGYRKVVEYEELRHGPLIKGKET